MAGLMAMSAVLDSDPPTDPTIKVDVVISVATSVPPPDTVWTDSFGG